MQPEGVARDFLPYNPDQQYVLPPDLREWVPEDHLIWLLSDVVDSLDLSAIFVTYRKDDQGGRAGYHPAMTVKLILYAYCLGTTSSRKIERATYEACPSASCPPTSMPTTKAGQLQLQLQTPTPLQTKSHRSSWPPL